MFDVLLRDCLICDGTGAPAKCGSVGVTAGRIAAAGDLRGAKGKVELDGGGRVLAPGFIDVHSHADQTLLSFGHAPNLLYQGITTFVGGNCGSSPAPLGDLWPLSFTEFDAWHDLAQYKYSEPIALPVSQIRQKMIERRGHDIDWRTFAEFLDRVRGCGHSVNYVPLVGHCAIRLAVMGTRQDAPSPDEMKKMRALVSEAMDTGAHGISVGFDYEPAAVATAEEAIELARVAAGYGGVYTTHWRGSGITKGARTERHGRPRTRIDGIREAIRIGRDSGIRVLLSHLHGGWSIQPEPPDSLAAAIAQATMDVVDEAVAEGLDVTFDVIPSTVGGLMSMPYLVSYLAPWLREAGTMDRFAGLLAAPDRRDEIRSVVMAGRWWNLNPNINPRWAEWLRVRTGDRVASLAVLAADNGCDPLDKMFELICDQPDIQAYMHGSVSETGVRTYLAHPRALVGTDSGAFDARWEVSALPGYRPNCNAFGAMCAFINTYRPGTLEQAIEQVTSRPARWFGLSDRGVIRKGAHADIVVFDASAYGYQGDEFEPRRYAGGVEHVLVNGEFAIRDGQLTSARPGMIIPRS